jgi:hypothetical protein
MADLDFIHVRFIGGLAGVQWSFGTYWKVLEYIGPDSSGKIIDDLAQDMWSQMTADAAADTSLLAAIYRNQTQTDQAIVYFTGLNGTASGDAHPPHQCIRINLYGQALPEDPIRRSSVHVPGAAEAQSRDGVRTSGFWQTLSNWLQTSSINTGPNGANLQCQVRYNSGTPEVPVWSYAPVNAARVKSQFMVLRRRKRNRFGV